MHRLLLGVLALMGGVAAGDVEAEMVRVYLGTYADGIYMFTLDTETGEAGAVERANGSVEKCYPRTRPLEGAVVT